MVSYSKRQISKKEKEKNKGKKEERKVRWEGRK